MFWHFLDLAQSMCIIFLWPYSTTWLYNHLRREFNDSLVLRVTHCDTHCMMLRGAQALLRHCEHLCIQWQAQALAHKNHTTQPPYGARQDFANVTQQSFQRRCSFQRHAGVRVCQNRDSKDQNRTAHLPSKCWSSFPKRISSTQPPKGAAILQKSRSKLPGER